MNRMPPTPEDAPGRCLGCPVMNRMPPTLNLGSCLEAYLRPLRSCVPAAASCRRLFGACSRCSWCGPKSRRRKTGRKSFESSYCTAVCSLLACQLCFMRRQRRYSGARHQGSRLSLWAGDCPSHEAGGSNRRRNKNAEPCAAPSCAVASILSICVYLIYVLRWTVRRGAASGRRWR